MDDLNDEVNFDEFGTIDPFVDSDKILSDFNSESSFDDTANVDSVEETMSSFILGNSLTYLLASIFIGLFILVCLSWLAKRKNKKINEKPESKKDLKSMFNSFDPSVDYRKLNEERDQKSKEKSVKDPIQDFSDGRLENLPFQCPFMEAFKHAKKSKESDELSNVSEKKSVVSNVPNPGKQLNQQSSPPPIKTDVEEILEETKKSPEPGRVSSFYEHIPSHVKQLEQKQFLQKFDELDLRAEQQAREEQLNQIYTLMAEKSDTFGVKSFDDVKDQMRLYIR